MSQPMIGEISHTWPFDDDDRTDRDTNDRAVLHQALTWATRHGWTRVETARWSRPHVPPSRRWTPGGRVIVDWSTGSQLAICYRAPLTRPDRLRQWAYSWEDHITVGSVRQGLAVLAAVGLIPSVLGSVDCECPLGDETDQHDPDCPWGTR